MIKILFQNYKVVQIRQIYENPITMHFPKEKFSFFNKYTRFSFFIFFFIFSSCIQKEKDVITVDFSHVYSDSASSQQTNSENHLRVAVAAIISPSESFVYYEELFDYISKRINRPVLFVQRKTYSETNEMLADKKVDIAFICSGAYVTHKNVCDLLVVPVCNSLPYYQAYIIVNANSATQTIADLKDKTFAFSDPLSNSGKLFPEFRLKELFNLRSDEFFSKTIYTNAHDVSIQLVSKSVVDGASVDGLIYEYLRKKSPEKVENIRIIEKSEYFGIPPVVSSKWIDPDLKNKLREIFLTIHNDTTGNKILNKLMIDKFTISTDTLYNKVSNMNSFIGQ